MIKETPEWQMGRRGEILQLATLTRFGFSMIDVSGSTNNKAPLLHRYDVDFTAPDSMSFKSGPLWVEFKTKSKHMAWHGGSRDDAVRVPPRLEQTMDRVNYLAYCHVQRTSRIPVVLLVLSIEEGELLGNSLRGLGEPRFSNNPQFDRVNWDVRKFRTISQFDCDRLRGYFYYPDGSMRDAPIDIPSSEKLKKALEYLKPRQLELDLLMIDLVGQFESDWLKEGWE